MKVLISGASGLVGSALVPFLAAGGHEVGRLVRSPSAAATDRIFWDAASGQVDLGAWTGSDAVVHLAGENIAAGRWTSARKERIRASRVGGTGQLCLALAGWSPRPKVFVCASAIGIYGDRGDEVLDETSPSGQGFLAEVCRDWEAAAEPARQAGVRVVHLRFGVILSPLGGALAKMLLPFRLGLGGRLGSGRQYLSWIALDDAVRAIHHALLREEVQGPVNVVAPNPASNRQFTRTLARVLWRPAFFPMPAWVARLAFGEMANELLLASTRVMPRRLQETGFRFDHPDLEEALRHLLGQTALGNPPERTE